MLDGDGIARLIYLSLLLAAVTGYFVVENRKNLGKTAQQAAIWGLIFLGAIAGFGLWDDIKRNTTGREAIQSDGTVALPMAPDGHFYVTADVNGESIRFVVDTGASDIVLTQADATRAGFDVTELSYFGQARTANGLVDTAPVTLDSVGFGGFLDEGVSAVVNAGDLDTSLLGMSYLSRYRITLSGETMTLAR